MARGLILALQFMTRLPLPTLKDFHAEELRNSAIWLPMVGVIVGAIVAALSWSGSRLDPWLGALLGTIAWVWVTGGLHLDGLADLADALGASHRNPQRFLEVLRDPHLGAFGVMSLVTAMATKLVLLSIALRQDAQVGFWLPLICAWARGGAIAWSAALPPLAAGSGERFAWRTSKGMVAGWCAVLLIASALTTPILAVAPLVLFGWGWFLQRHVGGMTGDCLGAGIEVSEMLLLLCVVTADLAYG